MVQLGDPGGRVLGVIHLRPLPGSPGYEGGRDAVREAARRDAQACLDGGLHGFVIENFGDNPFLKDRVGPQVIAEMSRIATELVELAGADRLVGINVLRNDARAALAIAGASGASFVRVNVHTGVMYCDQGIIEGRAAETLRLRRALEIRDVAIAADVWVKHGAPPQGTTIEEAARDAAYRGRADALIVSGPETGAATAVADIQAVKRGVPDRPVLVGSGVTANDAAGVLAVADGIIVGTFLKEDGDVHRPIDVRRVRVLVAATGV